MKSKKLIFGTLVGSVLLAGTAWADRGPEKYDGTMPEDRVEVIEQHESDLRYRFDEQADWDERRDLTGPEFRNEQPDIDRSTESVRQPGPGSDWDNNPQEYPGRLQYDEQRLKDVNRD